MKKETYTAIEITSSHIKLLQSKIVHGKNLITVLDVRPFQSQTDDELEKLMTEMLLTRSIEPDNFTLILPRQQSIIKQMNLPSQTDVEIKKMIGLQLANKIPYAVEDVIYDYHLLDRTTAGYSKILVVCVNKDIINRLLNVIKKSNLTLGKVVLSSFGVLQWARYQTQKKALTPEHTYAIVNIDESHTEICFCKNSYLFYSRSFRFGARDIHEENLIGIVNQIELSLGTYVKESMGPEIKKILILSDMQEVEVLRGRLENKLKLPVSIVSPWLNVLSKKNVDLSSLKTRHGISAVVPTGYLLFQDKAMMNLTPKEVHDTKRSKLQRREIYKLFALLFITILISAGFLGYDLYTKITRLETLEKTSKKLEETLAQTKEKVSFVEVMQKELSQRIFVPDLILDLYDLSTPEISFRSLSLDDKGSFIIQGYGQTSSSVNSFQNRLVRSEAFIDVNLQFATQRKIFNQEVTDFKITSFINREHKDD